ncbi:hypothetical protein NBRC10512_003472 [Rhodotorula toruloides]|uniref:Tethering factor for nuclear proteasome STS1 n=2 Tax=Rhodotorula toruloides TaxID=5286 RepID=A0A061AIZ1_RHOTO|nr:nuclear envelope, Cut8 family protein [Rhodotorula toruloides NP11]EMS23362.1 nuclear envelope, Cut8 family protein [Rhodotorula toruloides NP11]KAJ8296696.1 Tethering factor for nuclear proteasome STS1 [Rhodotorula toruloides]CDR37484.1 RHTO0S02e15456g1_1 [Rhodotorula toruloides]
MQWQSGFYSQPVQTLPSSPFSQPHLLSSPSHAPSSSLATTSPAHAVPFGAIPGSQPGVLGWGVGMSAANGGGFGFGFAGARMTGSGGGGASGSSSRAQTPASVGWGSAQGARPSSPAQGGPSTPSNSRRRRRSASPEGSSDEEGPSLRAVRPMRSLQSGGGKRARTVQAASEAASGSTASSQGPVVDLGKALASLDKPALLNVFSKLLTTSPHLASTIASFLPTPTLSTTLESLSSLEHAVIAATPTGAFLRPDYIFSRVRLPLEEYVSETKRYLSLFVPVQQPTGPLSEDNLAHPSTAFQFLHALTSSLLRLESTLPSLNSSSTPSAPPANPLASHLVPLTLNAWHLFLTRLSSAINTQGRVLPTSLVQSWFDQVDALAGSNSLGVGRERASQVRKAMEGVRERMGREVGWLIGLKSDAAAVGGSGMEGVEQEEEL